MTKLLFPSDLNNPVTRWADSTLRVMDATLSSAQSVGDGIDRVTRAAASAPVTAAAVPATDSVGETASPGLFSLTLAVALQRSALDLMAKGWLQWMSMMGTVAGAAARRLEAPSPVDEAPAAKAAASRRGSAGVDVPATSTRHRASGTRTSRKPQEQAGSAGREHAFAGSEPRRKRGTKKAADAKKRARASAAPGG